MRSSNALTIFMASLVCANCFQQSFNQLSISDSQISDSTQTSAGATAENASSSITDTGTSGGASQTGGASGSTTTTLSMTSDTGTTMQVDDGITGSTTEGTSTSGSSTSTVDTSATSTGSTTGQEECAVVFDDTCYSSATVRLVFVTSSTYTGAMMGNPDALCNQAAANLPGAGEYKAWATTQNGPPAMRFDKTFKGPYVKRKPEHPDEFVLVAMGWADLTGGDLKAAIDVTETGTAVEGYAWTAATHKGSYDSYFATCNKWSNENSDDAHPFTCEEAKNDYGSVGIIGETSPSWSYTSEFDCDGIPFCCYGIDWLASETFECDSEHHLYCFRDQAK